jgi:hypothetical protein
MGKITTTGGSGWVEVIPENASSPADVYVHTDKSGASLELSQVRELIEDLARVAGFISEPTGNGMGIIIQFPESPAVQERRDELAEKFYHTDFGSLEFGSQHAIEFIIDGEKARGELK